MDARKVMLDDDQVTLLMKIINDNEYWRTLRVKGTGIPTGVNKIQRLLSGKTNLNNFNLLDNLREEAGKRLSKNDQNRLVPTFALYKLIINLESPDADFYFKELEIDYLTYQTYKFCGISENDLQGVHHDVRKSDIEMVTKTFLLTRVQNKIMHSYQPNIKIVLHDDFKRLVRDDFLKRRPNAVKALNNYIANVYVRYKYLFLHDCGWGLHNLLFYLAGAPPYIKGTINGNELLVSMIDWNDIQYRCSVVLEAAFSNEEYRKAVFPTFNSLMDLFEKIKCDPMHYYNEGEDARNIILGCFKNALLKTGILVVLIKTQQQANEVEKIMPGIIHNVNVSEMIKNRQVIGLARLRKTNLFSTLHKDVIKIVLNHTAIPEPEELLSHDKPHKRKK